MSTENPVRLSGGLQCCFNKFCFTRCGSKSSLGSHITQLNIQSVDSGRQTDQEECVKILFLEDVIFRETHTASNFRVNEH